MKLLRLLVCSALATLVVPVLGCAADATDDATSGETALDGDRGDEEAVGETAEALSTKCSISRAQILASVTGGRQTAIERGFTWWDAQVPYSQSRTYKGYRTDCSGFVSMAWQLGTSFTTASFSDGSARSHAIGAYSNLRPGDALVRRSNGAGHITMFLGWNDASKTSACVLEQASTALDMEFGTRSVSSLRASGYRAIRADKFE